MNFEKLKTKIEKAVARANFSIRADVSRLLKASFKREMKKESKQALRWILDNAKVAKAEELPICQDTGLPVVFIEAGRDIKVTALLVEAVKTAVTNGYRKNFLRPSAVDPLLRGKSSYSGVIYHLDFSLKRKGLKIIIFPKGFGSENKSSLKMFNPTASSEQIEDFIIESVKAAGPESCPPFVVGVGIGGTSDTALLLAKKSLLGRIDLPNSDKLLNSLEKSLLKRINLLGIGPMGLGGKCTSLAVKIQKLPTHIAGLPVGVNISCHALRSAVVRIKEEG
ncbi:MAG: fumarate hydratase [Candidatus Susulua stagnicola]|nr:fumarate hydratase [Candidatus Susulua stagnicola]